MGLTVKKAYPLIGPKTLPGLVRGEELIFWQSYDAKPPNT
jgi:hypothetical protein